MYAIVTPVLYRELVVQDLGRLIRGIERPLPDGAAFEHAKSISTTEEVPLHKIHALALVKTLYLVHASSRKMVAPELRTTNKAYEFPSSETCDVDTLGRVDLDGWETSKIITRRARKVHGESFQLLPQAENLVLGAWDDERWTTYIVPYLASLSESAVLPDNEIGSLLAQYEPCLEIFQSTNVCRRLRHGLYSHRPPNGGRNPAGCSLGISIVHAAKIKDIRLYSPYAGLTRLYIDIGLLKLHESDLDNRTERVEPFKSYDWALYPLDRNRLSEAEMAKGNASLEICLVSRAGDEAGRALAMKVKKALEEFHEEVVERKGKDRLWKGTVTILLGDQISRCPCCGMRD